MEQRAGGGVAWEGGQKHGEDVIWGAIIRQNLQIVCQNRNEETENRNEDTNITNMQLSPQHRT